MRVLPYRLPSPGAPVSGEGVSASVGGQSLHPLYLERHGFNVLRVPGAWTVQLQRFLLSVKELVHFAERGAA